MNALITQCPTAVARVTFDLLLMFKTSCKSQQLILCDSGEYFDVLATSELRKRPGNSDVDNASRDCFWGRAFCLRPLKQSHDALSTSLLTGLLCNSEVANSMSTKQLQNNFIKIIHFCLKILL